MNIMNIFFGRILKKLDELIQAVESLNISIQEQKALAEQLRASTEALNQAVISNQPKE